MIRRTALPLLLVGVLTLSGCFPAGLLIHQRDSGTAAPREAVPIAELPAVIALRHPLALPEIEGVAFVLTMESASPIYVSSGTELDEAMFDFVEQGCTLTLRQSTADAAGLEFVTDDVLNSSLVTLAYLGPIVADGYQIVSWPLNGGESSIEAVATVVVGEDGGITIAVARALGSLGEFFYVELACGPETSTHRLYAEIVAPNLSVVMLL